MQQQCVSVDLVILMRSMKALIPSEESVRLDLDAEINKHMVLIERSFW
jgi:hypothetical protein